jgi:hypothetical protein
MMIWTLDSGRIACRRPTEFAGVVSILWLKGKVLHPVATNLHRLSAPINLMEGNDADAQC